MTQPNLAWHDPAELRWTVAEWAARVGVPAPRVAVRAMRRKWASISTAGQLTLNIELLGLPRRLGEYVVVHEIVHLLAPNHGGLYRSLLDAYLPDWRDRERELNNPNVASPADSPQPQAARHNPTSAEAAGYASSVIAEPARLTLPSRRTIL